MKESTYKTYDDLPLFLNAAMVAQVLGVAPSSAYELMHEKDFPTLRVGSRMVVPKEKFIEWVGSTRWAVVMHEKNKTAGRLGTCKELLPRTE